MFLRWNLTVFSDTAHRAGDFLVGCAIRQKGKDFPLPVGQRFQRLGSRLKSGLGLTRLGPGGIEQLGEIFACHAVRASIRGVLIFGAQELRHGHAEAGGQRQFPLCWPYWQKKVICPGMRRMSKDGYIANALTGSFQEISA